MDDAHGQDPELAQAGYALASWVRARRATWMSTPLATSSVADLAAEPIASPVATPVPETAVSSGHRDVAGPVASVPAPAPEPRRKWIVPPAVGAAARPLAAVGAVLAGAAIVFSTRDAIMDTIGAVAARVRTATPVRPAVPTAPPSAPARAHGILAINSNPTGARVLVDGVARGVTPLTLRDVVVGRHEVTLEGDAGVVRRAVVLTQGQTVSIEEGIFSGWVTVFAPIELTIADGDRVVRADERNQVMLSPGRHELHLTNRALNYETVRVVEILPGEATTVRVTPDPAALTVTASEAAEVWLDGAVIGATPLHVQNVPLGTHDVVVKRAAGGERRFSISVGTNGSTLHVVF